MLFFIRFLCFVILFTACTSIETKSSQAEESPLTLCFCLENSPNDSLLYDTCMKQFFHREQTPTSKWEKASELRVCSCNVTLPNFRARPQIVFKSYEYDFDTIPEGVQIEGVYEFINAGFTPLVISNCNGAGAIVPNWDKNPIAPGETGVIEFLFSSEGRKGKQMKSLTVTANTPPSTSTTVILRGYVVGKPEN
jgi:hypothetical protein